MVDQPNTARTGTTGPEGGLDGGADGGAPASRAPAARYGRPPSRARRRVAVAAAVALLAGALAWTLWTATRLSDEPVSSTDVGFAVRGDDRVEVTFDVHFNGDLPPDARAVCTVQALNRIHAEIGLIDVVVGRAARGSVRVTRTVPTSERAVTGLVKACALG